MGSKKYISLFAIYLVLSLIIIIPPSTRIAQFTHADRLKTPVSLGIEKVEVTT